MKRLLNLIKKIKKKFIGRELTEEEKIDMSVW